MKLESDAYLELTISVSFLTPQKVAEIKPERVREELSPEMKQLIDERYASEAFQKLLLYKSKEKVEDWQKETKEVDRLVKAKDKRLLIEADRRSYVFNHIHRWETFKDRRN